MTYFPSVISSVTSLEEAKKGLESKDVSGFLAQVQIIISKFDLNDMFGIVLIHRHTVVKSGYRLFDFKTTLQPFPLADDAEDLHGFKIRPKSLAYLGGSWTPYEYEFGSPSAVTSDFFVEIGQLLDEFELDKIFGLRQYSPSDPEELEITDHNGISVKVPWDHANHNDGDEFTTTFWAFPRGTLPSGSPKTYKCHCRNTGSKDNPNHNHIDS